MMTFVAFCLHKLQNPNEGPRVKVPSNDNSSYKQHKSKLHEIMQQQGMDAEYQNYLPLNPISPRYTPSIERPTRNSSNYEINRQDQQCGI